MAFSNDSADNLLNLIGRNIAWANLGDASGVQPSAGAGSLYCVFHTAAVLSGSVATTSESADLARQPIARSGSGFSAPEDGTVANSRRIRNAAVIEVTNTGGSPVTVEAVSLTLAASGGSEILLADTSISETVAAGNILRFAIGALSFQLVTLPDA